MADNYAVEAMLGGGPRSTASTRCCPIHHLCLFKLGVPLGEMWYLHELAAWLREHNRSRFLLTAPPLRMPGIVGSPLTPIAHRLTTAQAGSPARSDAFDISKAW